MTQSIPSSFNPEDLQKLMEQAAERESTESTDGVTYGSQKLTGKQLTEAANQVIEDSFDVCDDPLFHKAIICQLITNMIHWHTKTGEACFDAEQTVAGISWLRDAGQFQAILALLDNISVGPQDFLCSQHECDDTCSHD